MMGPLMPLVGTGCLVLIAGLTGLFAFKTVSTPLPALPSIENSENTEATAPDLTNQSRRVRSDRYYASVIERPLFAPTRRPIEPQAAETPPLEPEIASAADIPPDDIQPKPPQLRLHGTMIAGDGLSALLSHSDGDPEWLHAGAEIQGWKLSEVGDGWATLRNGTQTFKLEMY